MPVDCLSLGAEPSALLRQACILTGGRHHALPTGRLPHSLQEVLVPLLLFHFLPGVAVRQELSTVEDVQNLAAVCSCHGEPCEIAYMCSCCLAIYCSATRAICPACRTRFPPCTELDPPLAELDVGGIGAA